MCCANCANGKKNHEWQTTFWFIWWSRSVRVSPMLNVIYEVVTFCGRQNKERKIKNAYPLEMVWLTSSLLLSIRYILLSTNFNISLFFMNCKTEFMRVSIGVYSFRICTLVYFISPVEGNNVFFGTFRFISKVWKSVEHTNILLKFSIYFIPFVQAIVAIYFHIHYLGFIIHGYCMIFRRSCFLSAYDFGRNGNNGFSTTPFDKMKLNEQWESERERRDRSASSLLLLQTR